MKYIYILGLLAIVIICCLLIKKKVKVEDFNPIPVEKIMAREEKKGLDFNLENDTPPPKGTNIVLVKAVLDGGPQTGIVVNNKSYEKKPQTFEIEQAKCMDVKFCENLTENMNCGYCLQDDLEGKHAFHFGDDKGPHLNKGANEKSLCKRGINRDGKTEWISPAYLNGKKKNEKEKELAFITNKYHKDDPIRLTEEARLVKELSTMGIEDTGSSGCMKMRERYICSQVNDCSPMNYTKFGINAKDICGFCADTGKAMARQDVPPDITKHKITRMEYVSNPTCDNVDIFGDGVNCASFNGDKGKCLSQKSLSDPTLYACAYNYNSKRQVRKIKVPLPSIPKYAKNGKTKIYDKCDSEWGLIRPSQCNWFEEAYPCLKSKTGGPHEKKCLQSLWQQMGFQTQYTELLNNGEGELVKKWQKADVDSVLASMESLYEKIYSQDYEVAKKWAKICFNLDPNICNRAGFITSKYPSQYWKETSDPCMNLLYRYGGGQRNGLANPKNTKSMSFGYLGSSKKENDVNTRAGMRKETRNYPSNFRANQSEQERLGGSLSGYYTFSKVGKSMPQRSYINKLRELNKLKDMPNWKAKRVRNTSNWRKSSEDKFSNVRWVDKLTASKMITGEKPSFPVTQTKPCWPDFARRMLSHPQVKLLDLKTLSFKSAREFHQLSYWGNDSIVYENLRRSGNRFFKGGSKRFIVKDTYEQDTFPYWKWLEVNSAFWKVRWGMFYKMVLNYSGSKGSTYKEIMRPSNEQTAYRIAMAAGIKIGGGNPDSGGGNDAAACDNKAEGDTCSYVYGGGTNAGNTFNGACSNGVCGYRFAGNYGTKGLYYYTSGSYGNRAYFGRYGSTNQAKTNLNCAPKCRVGGNSTSTVIIFSPDSRFYNVLPDTYNLNEALTKPKLLVIADRGIKYKYLFVQTYTRPGFPYHNFLNVMSKN